MLTQLLARGSLLRRLAEEVGRSVWKLFGSLRNVARWSLDNVRFVSWEEWRCALGRSEEGPSRTQIPQAASPAPSSSALAQVQCPCVQIDAGLELVLLGAVSQDGLPGWVGPEPVIVAESTSFRATLRQG